MQIRSAIALDHLKNYIYIEADKEAHVREACKGMRNIFTGSKILLVPIKEMTDVLSVESKAIDISRDTWVRMKIGTYKGDLAQVVDVDNVRQRVTVKLIPRIDLQALANKLNMASSCWAISHLFSVSISLDIYIGYRKDGFLYKTVSMKSISTQNIQPSFDELEKFRQPNENRDGDMASLSTLFANRKKGHFMKGDRVIIIKGDLKNLKGWVEKVEESTVHIKPNAADLPLWNPKEVTTQEYNEFYRKAFWILYRLPTSQQSCKVLFCCMQATYINVDGDGIVPVESAKFNE
ncbi:global transcription factor group A2 [Artemisia annua]|uniref:Global transcription factor group A2 n=1 Tax=Artemisia annua TaxID=35608 RepID=A0A2U1L831_ARTAN|nr:global transcription factor group A2 [Artemisia annua]